MNLFFKRIRSVLLGVALIGISLLVVSCGAKTSAPLAPPAPPVEVPSTPIVLQFVEYSDIRIDLSTISTIAEESVNVYAAVGAGGEYSGVIAVHAMYVQAAEDFFGEITDGLGDLEIPVSEDTTTFESDATIGPRNGTVKMDFADFDLDGIGGPEGCSGHTAALPICVRMWMNDERFIAWIFDEYPTGDNPGMSRFRMFFIYDLEDEVSVAISFDHRDPEDKSIDVQLREVATEGELSGWGDDTGSFHVEILQDGPDVSALKRLNWNSEQYKDTVAVDGNQFLSQFIEGEDFWSGSIAGVNYPPVPLFNLCVRLSTGDAAAQSNCDTLGISVTDIPFAVLPTLADVQFHDFPETPTF